MMTFPEGLNVIPSPHAPSIAPTIRSAASINQALLNQLAMASPSPGRTPASLTAALHDVLRHGSALNSTNRPWGRVKVPYAFPLTVAQEAKAKMEEREQRFKNLVVLALVLVAAGSVAQYLAAAEATAGARMYADAVARVMHKREWDLACLKESEVGKGKRGWGVGSRGSRKRVKLSSSVTSVSTEGEEGENPFLDEPQGFPSDGEEEEEIPHLVDLEIKNDQTQSDISWCAHSGQAAMAALASELKWFEENWPSETEHDQNDEQDDDNDAGSQASNPFIESPATRRNPNVRSSPGQEEKGEDQDSAPEQLSGLLAVFAAIAQLSLFFPYVSGDFHTLDALSSTCVPVKVVLIDERERIKLDLPVDRARYDRELEKARKGLREAEKKWDGRKDDAALRAITCIASTAGAIDAGLDGNGEEFKGLDGGDSDEGEEDEEDVELKGVLIATLGVAQVTLAACVTSDKWPSEAYDYTRSYPSSPTIPRPSNEGPSVRKHTLEAAQAQKEKRMARAEKEAGEEKRRGDIRASLGKLVCQMGLEDRGDQRVDKEEFDELERGTLAALKLLGLGTFKLFFNLFEGTEEWEDEKPVDLSGVVQPEGVHVRSLGPERTGKLKEGERISSWLRSVTSSPKSTPEPLDALDDETPGEASVEASSHTDHARRPLPTRQFLVPKQPRPSTSRSAALQTIVNAKERAEAALITFQRQVDTAQIRTKAEEELRKIREQGELEMREQEEELARLNRELEEMRKQDAQEQKRFEQRLMEMKREYMPDDKPGERQPSHTGVGPEMGGSQVRVEKERAEGIAVEEDKVPMDENPAEIQEEEEKRDDTTMEDARPTKKQKQSKNAKLAAVWGSKKRLSKAKKEASAKALEKARESTARRKQEQLLEEQARAEREAAREAAGMNAEDGKGEMKKKKQGSEKAKRKGRSKAQKEASEKALEKAREAAKVKHALKRAGRS